VRPDLQYSKAKGVLLTLILFGLFFFVLDVSKLLKQILKTNISIYLIGLILFSSVYPLTALRWKRLCSVNYEVGFNQCLKIISISYGINKILPFNSGDIVRSKIMERYIDIESHGDVLGLVAVERLSDIAVLTMLSTVPAFFIFSESLNIRNVLLLPALAVIIGFYLVRSKSSKLRETVKVLPETNLLDYKEILLDAIGGFNQLDKRYYAETVLLTFVRWIFDILSLYVLASSIGMSFGFWSAALLTCVMSLVSSMPITPSGAGAAELSGTALMTALGYEPAVGGALVLLQRSFGVAFMGMVGLIVVNYEGVSLQGFR